MGGNWEMMYGFIISVIDEKDGRENVRVWIRKNEVGEFIFVVFYLKYINKNEIYMNIVLFLFYLNMIGILRLCNDNYDLIIISKLRENG